MSEKKAKKIEAKTENKRAKASAAKLEKVLNALKGDGMTAKQLAARFQLEGKNRLMKAKRLVYFAQSKGAKVTVTATDAQKKENPDGPGRFPARYSIS